MRNNITSGKVLVAGKPAPGLAMHGYDPVAYFTEGKPAVGDAAYSLVHQDATYRFASKSNLEAFKSNPGGHAPQYGGFCAFGVSVGSKFDGDPNKWRIVDNKLYLNLDSSIQQEWNKDIPGNIAKAETNWRALADAIP